MTSIRILVSAAALLTATLAGADTLQNYTYRVKVPAVSGMTCAQHATEMASAFIAANGNLVTNVQGLCQGQQPVGQNIVDIVVISYQAANEQRPYRAIITGEEFNGTSFSEVFATYGACLQAMSVQNDAFNAETGLTAVATYCEGGGDFVQGYKMTVEGFGQPQNQMSGFMRAVECDTDYTNILPIAAKLIAGAGGIISYEDAQRVFFYAPKNIAVSVSDFAIYEGRECEDQQAIAEIIATNSGLTNVSSLCQADMGQKRLLVIGLGHSRLNEDYGLSSPDYASYVECVADRARVTAPYADQLSGALCEPNDSTTGHYKLHVFTKR